MEVDERLRAARGKAGKMLQRNWEKTWAILEAKFLKLSQFIAAQIHNLED
jgi:hypothetical protein